MMGGCLKEKKSNLVPVTKPTQTPTISLTIKVALDPSLEEIKSNAPYANANKYIIRTYKPDKDLYNTLFKAIDNMEATANSDYTDDMQDSLTHSPYSILMKGKGICGGFSNLGLNGLKHTMISIMSML